MALLDQQLKELQDKKIKAEFLRSVSDKLDKLERNDITSSALNEIIEFVDSKIEAIENGQESILNKMSDSITFTPEELEALKLVAAAAITRSQGSSEEAVPEIIQKKQRPQQTQKVFEDDDEEPIPRQRQSPPPRQRPQQNRPTQDKISFAMAHRNLDGKRCTVPTKSGGQVGGKIVGTDAPYLVVQTDTGHTINVPPEDVEVG